MRVLIVDSNRALAATVRRAVERLGYEAAIASNSDEAWSLYETAQFGVVIASAMLDGRSGLDLCREIRASETGLYTYFVLSNPAADRASHIDSLLAGADATLASPLDSRELQAVLATAERVLHLQDDLALRSARVDAVQAKLAERGREFAEETAYITHSNRRFMELFDGVPAACYSWDREGRIHEWNRAAVEMFGYQPEEVFTRHIWEVFRERGARQQEENIRRERAVIDSIFAGEPIAGAEMERRTKQGEKIWVLCNVVPMRTGDGTITGAISAHIDITARKQLDEVALEHLQRATDLNDKLTRQRKQLAQANVQLAQKVVTDGLTGLKNHRHAHELIGANVSFARRAGIALSVIMLDVDRFKQYNDTFGHPAGDEVLRQLAAVLMEIVRAHDIVARYGGEEFIVLCPGTDAAGAIEAAERLRAAVEAHEWPRRAITASFGIATFSPKIETAPELVGLADRALYASKERGRNCVTHCNDLRPDDDLRSADELRPIASRVTAA